MIVAFCERSEYIRYNCKIVMKFTMTTVKELRNVMIYFIFSHCAVCREMYDVYVHILYTRQQQFIRLYTVLISRLATTNPSTARSSVFHPLPSLPSSTASADIKQLNTGTLSESVCLSVCQWLCHEYHHSQYGIELSSQQCVIHCE